jgi:hypothetical protein
LAAFSAFGDYQAKQLPVGTLSLRAGCFAVFVGTGPASSGAWLTLFGGFNMRAAANDNVVAIADRISSLPTLVRKAAQRLTTATTAAEVLDAKAMAAVAYDAAKSAARFAKAKGRSMR